MKYINNKYSSNKYTLIASLLIANYSVPLAMANEVDFGGQTETYISDSVRNAVTFGYIYEDHDEPENESKFNNKNPYINVLIRPFEKSDFFYQLGMKNTQYSGEDKNESLNKDELSLAIGRTFKFDSVFFRPRFDYKYLTFGNPDRRSNYKIGLNTQYKFNKKISFDVKPRYQLSKININSRDPANPGRKNYRDYEWAIQLGATYSFNKKHRLTLAAEHFQLEIDGAVNPTAMESRYNQDLRLTYLYNNNGFAVSPYIRVGLNGKQTAVNGNERYDYTGRHGISVKKNLGKRWILLGDIYKQDFYREHYNGTLDEGTRDRLVFTLQASRLF